MFAIPGGSVADADLAHEVLVVPEQKFFSHGAVGAPMADRGHADAVGLARRCNFSAIRELHGVCKRPLHIANDAGPFTVLEFDRVFEDPGVGSEVEQVLQVVDVGIDSFRHAAVWPVNLDILTMTFAEAVPLLVGKHVEVERIECLQVHLAKRLGFAQAPKVGRVIGEYGCSEICCCCNGDDHGSRRLDQGFHGFEPFQIGKGFHVPMQARWALREENDTANMAHHFLCRVLNGVVMDLVDGMRVFVAAAEVGSISGAASRLGMSSKLASKYIAELEARLGTQLMQRTTRRLGLTAAGEQLVHRAADWLDQLEDMTGDLQEARKGLSGTLRVSAPVTFGELLVQPLLRAFRSQNPNLVIDLRLSDRFVDLAAEGIDLAIRIGQLDNSALIARRLGSTGLLIVAAPDYLGRHGRPEDMDSLSGHSCIRDTNLRGDGAWPLSDAQGTKRVTVSGPFLVNSARMARDLAVAGEGIALCPDYIVEEDLGLGRLEHVLPRIRGPVLDIHAVFLGQRRLARRTRAFLDFVAIHLTG
jgi:DNA-binding transcriptional LysR family regulator